MSYCKVQSTDKLSTSTKLNLSESISTEELQELIIFLVNYLKPLILNDLQETVLIRAWEGKTYIEISHETYNDSDYIKGVGAKLWQILSEALGEEVTKRNIRLVTKRNYEKLKKFNEDFQQEAINIPKVTNSLLESQELCNETVTNQYRDWGDAVDVSFFYGRSPELATLNKWIVRDRCRLIALLGMGGIGKTSLASMLARQVESEFEVVIWKSLRNAPEFKNLLAELIVAACDRQSLYVSDTIDGQINNLIKCLRQKHCLLIFDGVEHIFASGKLCGQYQEEFQSYGQLLRRVQDEQHQSCVVITSREKPGGLSLREGKKALVRSHWLKSLSINDCLEILSSSNLISSKSSDRKLASLCEGNPLILKMAISTINNLFDGYVQRFLDCNTILYGDTQKLIDRQFQRLTSLEQQVIYYLALENDSLKLEIFLHKVRDRVSASQLLEALESLQGRSLIDCNKTVSIRLSLMTEYLQARMF